jgi:hypothetical protein
VKKPAARTARKAAGKPGLAAVIRKSAAGGKGPAPRAPLTVEGYIAGLPGERRDAVTALRKLIVKNLPKGFTEATEFGMICYGVPLETYPDTYNGKPLAYLALASQKNHMALYAMSLYCDPGKERWFREEFRKAGKKLDMGKSCIRFRSLEDLPLGVIGKLVAGTSVKQFISTYEKARR